MVRSDKAYAGVIFTIDPETGFRDVVVIIAAWGLSKIVVQGIVTPDEYMVFKPLLSKENCIPIIKKTLGDKLRKVVYSKGRQDCQECEYVQLNPCYSFTTCITVRHSWGCSYARG